MNDHGKLRIGDPDLRSRGLELWTDDHQSAGPEALQVEGILFVSGVRMGTAKDTIHVLRDELTFLEDGGYRSPITWRSPLIFEDSPICPKDRWSTCPHGDCVLLDFVPKESRHETVPCRHIPLNEMGETLDALYRTGTYDEIQEALRQWLLETINRLEQPIQSQIAWRHEKAG